MILNGVMDVTLRYFTEFDKPAYQHITASTCGGIYARIYIVFCSACTMSSKRKFTFAISSPEEFLVAFIFETPKQNLIFLEHISGSSYQILCS